LGLERLETLLAAEPGLCLLDLFDAGDDLLVTRAWSGCGGLELGGAGVGWGREDRLDFLRRAAQATAVHFACHGTFDDANPYLSGVVAFHGAPAGEHVALGATCEVPQGSGRRYRLLTVAELLARGRLARCRLVVLSACRSGLPRQHAADEFTSLPGAFLVAGAAGVVASLWPVDDAATYLLMEEFYAAWAGSGGAEPSPASALLRARGRLAALPRGEATRRTASAPLPPGEFPFAAARFMMPFQYYGVR
jgi:CHAT domain-containing protein